MLYWKSGVQFVSYIHGLSMGSCVLSACREMGARPSHRPGRGGRGHPAEPGHPAGTLLALPHDRAPPNLHQVQPVPLTQRAAWGLRSQEHTAYAHAGKLRLLSLPAVYPDGLVCNSATTTQTDRFFFFFSFFFTFCLIQRQQL